MNFTAKQQVMIVSALTLAVQEGEEEMSAIAKTLGEPWAFAIASRLNLQDHIAPEPIQEEPKDVLLPSKGVLARLDEIEQSYTRQIDSINAVLDRALFDLAAAHARLDFMSAE